MALDLPGLHRQHRRHPVEGLDLGLLVERDHDRPLGWREVEADHVTDPGYKVGVPAVLERLGLMRARRDRCDTREHRERISRAKPVDVGRLAENLDDHESTGSRHLQERMAAASSLSLWANSRSFVVMGVDALAEPEWMVHPPP